MKELLKLSFSRRGRLLATILGPPLLGGLAYAGLLVVLLIFTEEAPVVEKITGAVALIALSITFAYLFVGVQSLVAGLLMEYVVRRFATRKSHIVASAVVMGFLTSATFNMYSPFMMLIGLFVGACSGLFLSHGFQVGESGNDSG